MSIFHITPAAHFYNYIQLETQTVDTTPTVGGTVCYNGATGSKYHGALYVSVPNDSSTYEYRALVDKLVGGTGITVAQDTTDKGKWTITATGGGGTGEIQATKVTVPKGSSSVTNDGICYANVHEDTTNGFVYRAYDKDGNTVAVSVYANGVNSRYVTIDFDSSTIFTKLNSEVYIDVIVGTTAANAETAGTTPPTPR